MLPHLTDTSIPKPYSHQKKVSDFMLRKLFIEDRPGVGVFAGLGSGKTRASLDAYHLLREVGAVEKVIVTAPPRVLRHTWPEEIKRWGYNSLRCGTVDSRSKCPNPKELDVVFCSPDSLHHLSKYARYFDAIFCDESTLFKNFGTKRMKAMRHLLPRVPKRVVMSATPMPNSHAELFSQAYIMDGGATLGYTQGEFNRRYMQKGGWGGRSWEVREGAEDEIMQALDPNVIFLRTEDYVDLPALIVNEVRITLPREARKAHDDLKKRLLAELDSKTVFAANGAVAYQKLKQVCNGFIIGEDDETHDIHREKVDAVEEIVTAAGAEQVLIFYHYKADLARLREALGRRATTDFDGWLKGDVQVLLLSIKSAAHGLNAQVNKAPHMIFYGLPDSNEAYTQAVGRLRRPGGAAHVFVHRVTAVDSVEDVIAGRLIDRQNNQTMFLNALRTWASL